MGDKQQISSGFLSVGNLKNAHHEGVELAKLVQEIQIHFNGFKASLFEETPAIPAYR